MCILITVPAIGQHAIVNAAISIVIEAEIAPFVHGLLSIIVEPVVPGLVRTSEGHWLTGRAVVLITLSVSVRVETDGLAYPHGERRGGQ